MVSSLLSLIRNSCERMVMREPHEQKVLKTTSTYRFISGEANDKSVKYLIPREYGKYLEKAISSNVTFEKKDRFFFHLTLNRQVYIPSKEIVIDLPPRKGSLKPTDAVWIPVDDFGGIRQNSKCEPKNRYRYLNGTFLATQDQVKGEALWLVKSAYILLYFIHRLCVCKIPCGYRTLHVGAKPPPKCFVSSCIFHIISHYLKSIDSFYIKLGR